MSTYERTSKVVDSDIPTGYEVTFHEIRGYDSPDRWFVCTGPHGWKKEVGERRDAIVACVRHADAMKPIPLDNSGVFPCYLCRGMKDRSVRPHECPVCGGTNSLTALEMAQTFDGLVRLGEIAGRMLVDGAMPKWVKALDPRSRSSVETFAKNPCKHCGSWLLEPGWVGSAYCSRRCCVEDYKVDPGYARTILDSYTEEMVREREAAMLSIEDPEG